MQVSLTGREQAYKVGSWLVDSFDQTNTQIQASWQAEHSQNDTHADTTHFSVLVQKGAVRDDGTPSAGSLTVQGLTTLNALIATQLSVETVKANQVIVGNHLLLTPASTLIADLPPGLTAISVATNVFATNDVVALFARGNTEFVQVTGAPTAIPGGFSFPVTRGYGGVLPALQWFSGDPAYDTGQTGSLFLDFYVSTGSAGGTGPGIQGVKRTSNTWNALAVRWVIGNLNGLYGYGANLNGIAIGDPANANITIEETNGIRILQGTTVFAQMNASVFTLGLPGGNHVKWDGTNLEVISLNLTINQTGVTIAHSASSSGSNAYAFTTGFTGTNLIGVTNVEIGGSALRQILLLNSTTMASQQIQCVLNAQAAVKNVVLTANADDIHADSFLSLGGGDFVPSVSASWNIGRSNLAWVDFWLQGKIRFANATHPTATYITNDTGDHISFVANSQLIAWDGTNFFPNQNNTNNLGGGGTTAWANLYFGSKLIFTAAASFPNTWINLDAQDRIAMYVNSVGIGWDGVQFIPFNDGTKNIGFGTLRWNTIFATNNVINTSDAREKKNVVDLTRGLPFLLALRPVDYEWIKPEWGTGVRHGFIAQEVASVSRTFGGLSFDKEGEATGLDYNSFIPVLVKAIQELAKRVERLES